MREKNFFVNFLIGRDLLNVYAFQLIETHRERVREGGELVMKS